MALPRYSALVPSAPLDIGRRKLIAGLLVGGAAAGIAACSPESGAAKVNFPQGVASGDPLADAVILWTRAVPKTPPGAPQQAGPLMVLWSVATDSAFADVVRSGAFATDASRDYTVKVDVNGLEPGRRYHYRFAVGDVHSPAGRTMTLPQGSPDRLRFALMSCSNYAFGFFNAYAHCAERTDIDAVLHVGDYIYEYGPGKYGDPAMEAADRKLMPQKEIVSLSDYRERYALYRSDPDVQAVHAAFPFITVWDDHELANDCWTGGAENHHPDEGSWDARKAAAIRAYGEWMPIRALEGDRTGRIYRTFTFGDLASLIMLDTRVYGRDRQLDYGRDVPFLEVSVDATDAENPRVVSDTHAGQRIPQPFDLTNSPPRRTNDPTVLRAVLKDGSAAQLPEGFGFVRDWDRFKHEVLNDPSRSILGMEQEAWLETELERSHAQGIPWRLLGQQTLMGLVRPVDPSPFLREDKIPPEHRGLIAQVRNLAEHQLPLGLDGFGEGYPVARSRLLSAAAHHGGNVVVLSGDSHNAWAFNLKDDKGRVAAVEIGGTSVTSPGFESALPLDTEGLAAAMTNANPEMQWCDLSTRGYSVVTVERDAVTAEWIATGSVKQRSSVATVIQRLRVAATPGEGTSAFTSA